MQKLGLLLACAAVALVLVVPATASAVPPSVAAATSTFDYTKNLHPLGYSARTVPLEQHRARSRCLQLRPRVRGQHGRPGNLCGLPADRRLLSRQAGGDHQLDGVRQPDEHGRQPGRRHRLGRSRLPLVELRDSGASGRWGEHSGFRSCPVYDPGAFCGDWPMFREPADPATGLPERGQEGVHIIDISDPTNPDVIGFVDTPCGSHTETLVPDLENDRLLIYSNSSANTTFGVPGGGGDAADAVRRHRHHRGPAGRSGVRFVPAVRAGGGPDGGRASLLPRHGSDPR